MRKVRVFLLVYLLFGLSMAVSAYVIDIYPLEIAAGYLSRAMSAGNADDMVSYITQAYRLIPPLGNPVWILPTHRTDFNLIRADIASILDRLSTISRTPRDTAAYAQTLNDVRGRLEVIIGHLYEAMPYIYLKPANLAAAAAYLSTPVLAWKLFARKGKVEERLRDRLQA
jgi:hypothetical protein